MVAVGMGLGDCWFHRQGDALAPIAGRVGPTLEEVAEPLDTVPADSNSPAFTRQ